MGLFRTSNTEKHPTVSAQDKDNIKWFWQRYLKENVLKLLGVLLIVVSQGVVYQQFLSLTDRSLRIIFENGTLTDLMWICVMVFGVFFYRGITSFLVPRFSALIATRAVMKMRDDLITHLMTLDLAFFERTSAGDLILRLVHQADTLSSFIGQTTIRAVRDGATLIVVSVYLCYKQPLLFAVAALVIPLIVLAMGRVTRRVKTIQASAERAMGQYMNSIDEVTSAMRTVKMSGQTDIETQRLQSDTRTMRTISVRLQTAQATAQPFVDFAAAFVFMLVIGGGGYVVLSPAYDVDGASIITFLLGLILVFDPGRRLAQFWTQVQSMLVVLNDMRRVHHERPSILDAPDAVGAFDVKGDFEIQNLSFGYDDDRLLFEDLNLTFKGGQTTAIVGTTGSGKTTLLSLLARLYDPKAGQITLGGVPITQLRQADLRAAFSVVAQDIVIFNASVRDNIRYIRPDATDADVDAAAQAAEIYDLMVERGDALVGPKGAQLSGGQKQRIGIARAFLRAAPIVLLDEATSALDQKTEDKVKVALERLSKDRTTIMIAHRLASVMRADCIHVLEAGKLVESGSHSDLMGSKGFYHTLFEAQQKNYNT